MDATINSGPEFVRGHLYTNSFWAQFAAPAPTTVWSPPPFLTLSDPSIWSVSTDVNATGQSTSNNLQIITTEPDTDGDAAILIQRHNARCPLCRKGGDKQPILPDA